MLERVEVGRNLRRAVGHRDRLARLSQDLQDGLALVYAIHGRFNLERRRLGPSKAVTRGTVRSHERAQEL